MLHVSLCALIASLRAYILVHNIVNIAFLFGKKQRVGEYYADAN